jgi:tRNA(Ile2) C34 agmatinyltransferase TiaS
MLRHGRRGSERVINLRTTTLQEIADELAQRAKPNCHVCGGSGRLGSLGPWYAGCPTCGGTGQVDDRKLLDVAAALRRLAVVALALIVLVTPL